MLTWVVLSGLGLGTTSFISMCAQRSQMLGRWVWMCKDVFTIVYHMIELLIPLTFQTLI